MKAKKKEEEWEERGTEDAEFLNFTEEGQMHEGTYESECEGNYGLDYLIGGIICNGSTVLRRKMSHVKIGEYVRIVFHGMREGKRGYYKNFEVFVRKSVESRE